MADFGLWISLCRILRDILGYAVSFFLRNKRKLSRSDIVKLRQKWKAEFEQKFRERKNLGLRSDVIIRDMKRVDGYPNVLDKGKGISSWFRVGLMGTYHKGIMLGLRWERLVFDKDKCKWRYSDYKNHEDGELTAILIGYVPFENIEAVDWDGDEYYGFPHIYCYFDTKRKEPYESLRFCEQKDFSDFKHYEDIAEYDDVRRSSKNSSIFLARLDAFKFWNKKRGY